MITRVLKLLRRRYIARKLGIPFDRQSTFSLPPKFKFRNGSELYIPVDQPNVALDFINVVIDDEYGIRKQKRRPQSVLDIGANVGVFSWYASQIWPEANIKAYEPNPAAWKWAQKNSTSTRVQFVNSAVGAIDGLASIGEESDWRLGTVAACSQGTVPLISLEHVVENFGGHIDFAKIDCEGFEWELFDRPEPFRAIDRVHMEYHLDSKHTLSFFKQVVKELGFRIERLQDHTGFGIAWLAR